MKILVTGGTVFVSKYIAEYFSLKGFEVFVLNRNTKPQLPNVHLIECNRKAINGKLKGLHFDTVIDVNAYTGEDINLLLDSLDSFDNYVMISSSAVYPETLDLPFKESDKCGKNKFWGSYGINKIAAENALFKRVPNAYIIRAPYLYGEYNNVYREAFVFDCAERNMPFYLPNDGSMLLQFFHVDDLSRFIEILLNTKPKQQIFNVGNTPITIKDWVTICYKAAGKVPHFKNICDDTEQRNYFPFYNYEYVLDITAQNSLMPRLLPLQEGLQRAYNWYKQNRNEVKAKNYFDYIENNFTHKK
ncbi:MAG: NAD-dependent epimerase/dehydratase family protein [Clostridia bacterium]|nr:NAD-dependent epimerase/dehydratase family protein [Clostridia bacterium]